MGRSRGGLTVGRQAFACKRRETAKIHALVDAVGRPIRLSLTPGRAGDAPQALPLAVSFHQVVHPIQTEFVGVTKPQPVRGDRMNVRENARLTPLG